MVKHMKRVDVKVVLVGESGSGKTALFDRFARDTFRSGHHETVGATFLSKEVVRGKESIVLGLWDTAGTERFRSVTQQYYRNAKAAVVCYDLIDAHSWRGLRSWINELRNHEEQCRIYICGTKKDLIEYPEDRGVPFEKVKFFAEGTQLAMFETSAKTGENVDSLFNKICDDIWPEVMSSHREKKVRGSTQVLRKSSKVVSCCTVL